MVDIMNVINFIYHVDSISYRYWLYHINYSCSNMMSILKSFSRSFLDDVIIFILKRFFTFQTLQTLETRGECYIWHFWRPVQLNFINTVSDTILAKYKPVLAHSKLLLATERLEWASIEIFYGACVSDIGLNLRAYAFFYLISVVFVIID